MVTLPQTAIQKMLGCRYPIIQTAMGWVATPELVAGTSNAGGFGASGDGGCDSGDAAGGASNGTGHAEHFPKQRA